MDESGFLARLRTLPLHPGARGLLDDVAALGDLIVTTDTLVEGVHFLSADPPEDVAWKLLGVNLSDLAAKGALPEGVLFNYPLRDPDWDGAFLDGLSEALSVYACPLLGGDTVTLPADAPRILTLTALGRSSSAPPRSQARPGDLLWVTGSIGDAGAGLAIAKGEPGPPELLRAYRRPVPRLAEGRTLAPVVNAMSDVSDGLLIDAARMAAASGLAIELDLAAVPLSSAYLACKGDTRASRLAAATAGDDYQLLFAAAPGFVPPVPAARVGAFAPGSGLALTYVGERLALPDRLGWLHQTPLAPGRPAP